MTALSIESGPEIMRTVSYWLPLVPVIVLSGFFGTLWRLLSKERLRNEEGAGAKSPR